MADSNIIRMPGMKAAPIAPRADRMRSDTIVVTVPWLDRVNKPSFQRALRVTDKVTQAAEEIKREGIIPGVITLGVLKGETYLLDGQHRMEAFRMSGAEEALADVRIRDFDSMAEMSKEFIKLNSALARMKNDDFLRAMESGNHHLADIRRRCPFVGYDHVRMTKPDGAGKLLLMANVIRVWFGSVGDVPHAGPATTTAAEMLDADNTKDLCEFLTTCFEAWGKDKENYRLWGSLNMGIIMWLWRRLVRGEGRTSSKRFVDLTRDQFRSCLMALSAEPLYVEWLRSRGLAEAHRSPAYARIRTAFTRRLVEMGIKGPKYPMVDW